jgi:hypothetical protein
MEEDDITLPRERSRRMQRTLEVAEHYRRGVPIELIAHDYGLAPSTVIKYARAFGLAPRVRRAGELAEQAQVILADYTGGTPLREMEQKYNCHRKEIWRLAKAAGLPGRRRGNPSPKQNLMQGGPLPPANAARKMDQGSGGQKTDLVDLLSSVGGIEVELIDRLAQAWTSLVLPTDGDERGTPITSMAVVPGDLAELELDARRGGALELNPAHAASAVEPSATVVGVRHPPADAACLYCLPEEVREMGTE